MTSTTELPTKLALAVAQRSEVEAMYNNLTFSIWYDGAIPVITVLHPEHGVMFEELASDKSEVMSQILAPWINGD